MISEMKKERITALLESIINHRKLFMGFAMIMVILYHSISSFPNKTIGMIFYPGFIGVDIFLLLSGYGLSNSFSKNKLGTFYQHRVVRIVPLFVLMILSVSIIDALIGQKTLTMFNLFANITTLSYLGLGGWFIEWYLCVLLYLCVLFPLFYKLLSAVRSDWGGICFIQS